MLLTNHVILITGAGGSVGSAAAKALAQQGAHLILLDKSIPKLEKIYDSILAVGGTEPILYPFDLAGADEDDYQNLADTIQYTYGSLQGVLYAAAELTAFTPISNHKTVDWGHTLNVNLNAAFLLSKVLLPVLQNSSKASLVFLSDSAVRTPKAY